MNGKEILVDTNIVIYLLQGNDTIAEVLQGKQLYISFITELELLGFQSATDEYEKQIEGFISECLVVPLNNSVKTQYRKLRKKSKLKLADSVIAATALSLGIPLLSADQQFKTIGSLQLIYYEK